MKLMNHAIKFWANYNDQTAYFWHSKWFSEGIPSNMHWVNLSVGIVVIYPKTVFFTTKKLPLASLVDFSGGVLPTSTPWLPCHGGPTGGCGIFMGFFASVGNWEIQVRMFCTKNVKSL